MLQPTIPPNEAERLAILRECGVLDTPPEPGFDGLVELACAIAEVPVALISLVDSDRQWFKARVGLDATQAPRSLSFCGHAILGEDPFIVEDATRDPRFADNPLVCEQPHVAFYVGIPLCVGPERLRVGTLCVIDHVPRVLPPTRIAKLGLIARQAEAVLEARRQRRLVEEQLVAHRQKEEQLSAIMTAMDEGVVMQRPDGSVVAFNPAAERILGLTSDQLVGRTSMDPRWRAVHADGRDFPRQDHPAMVTLRTGTPVRQVVMGVGVEGAIRRWLLINAQPMGRLDNGLPAGAVVSFSDITSLRQEEEARKRVEAQVARFFTLSLDLLCIASPDGRLLRVNPAWTAQLGWSQEELLSRPFIELVHPEDVSKTLAEAARLARGNTTVGFENRYRCKDGSFRNLSWVAAGSQEDGLLLAVARDVTSQRAFEAALTQARDAAEAAGRSKTEFLATMSHEIRTPMNGVIGLTEVLLDTPLDDAQRDLLRSIQSSGRALLDILNAILDWSRIQAGALQLERNAVDVLALARDVLTVLSPLALGKGLKVRLDGHPSDGPVRAALGDSGRIRQVLFNLVGNAIKFTTQGEVVVRVTTDAQVYDEYPQGCVRVTVTDTGIGISADQRERLFQRFTQADASTTRKYGGSGLGLAISRELVVAMGGTLGVTSAPGQGSSFVVVLPAADAHKVSASPNVENSAVRHGSSLKILLAEDNLINQRVATALLVKQGHTVEVVADGLQAVRAAMRGGWDIVFMDVQMPEMDGLQATQAIRAAERQTGSARLPVIALTASALPDERAACLASGMDEVLLKPITGDALSELISRRSAQR